MPDQYALPTLIFAAIAAVGTLFSIAAIFITRYRDRVELRVLSVTLKDDNVWVHVRNRGGTPTRLRGVFFEGGGFWSNSGLTPLAGRSETDFFNGVIVLKQYGRIGESLYVLDDSGRRSPAFTIPDEIRVKVNGEGAT